MSLTDAQYGEPWSKLNFKCGCGSCSTTGLRNLKDCSGKQVNFVDDESIADRVLACVNFCRGVPTEDLTFIMEQSPDYRDRHAFETTCVALYLRKQAKKDLSAVEVTVEKTP